MRPGYECSLALEGFRELGAAENALAVTFDARKEHEVPNALQRALNTFSWETESAVLEGAVATHCVQTLLDLARVNAARPGGDFQDSLVSRRVRTLRAASQRHIFRLSNFSLRMLQGYTDHPAFNPKSPGHDLIELMLRDMGSERLPIAKRGRRRF